MTSTLIVLCLPALANCSTVNPPAPRIVVKTETVRERVPSALVTPCRKKRRTPPIKATSDIVSRLQYTEAALDACDAKVTAIRNWDKG